MNNGINIYKDNWKRLRDVGLIPFPASKTYKGPVVDWKEYQGKSPTNDVFQEWSKEHPKENVWCLLNDKAVIEADSKEGERFVQSLGLPPCPTVRSGGKSFHYYFNNPSGLKALEIVSGDIKVEVRTGGVGVMVPPSIHPETKKRYEWIRAPWEIDYPDLPLEIYEKIAALGNGGKPMEKKVDPRIWKAESYMEGIRNEALFRFAASLRAKSISEEEAREQVLERARSCDPPLPEGEALAWLRSAWRYPEGVEVPEQILEMNKTWFVSTFGGKTGVYRETADPSGRIVLEGFSPYDFQTLYRNRSIAVGTKRNGESIEKPLGSYWLDHPQRRQYPDGIVFDPRGNCGDGAYNLWRGFSVAPAPGDWSLMKEHIRKIVCAGNKAHEEYLLNWMARAVQQPDDMGEVAVVLKGDRGAGKNVFAEAFGNLFGPSCLQLSRGDQVTGRFNDHLLNCVVLIANEAFYSGNKSEVGQLKRMITERTLAIEAKFKGIRQCRNMLHLIMLSNEDWVIPAGLDERRFFVLDVSNKRAGDKEYFAKIVEQMRGGGSAAMLHDLLDRDIEEWNHRDVPDTAGLREQKIFNMEPHKAWWFGLLSKGTSPWYWSDDNRRMVYHDDWRPVTVEILCRDYEEFFKARGHRHAFSAEQLGLPLKKLMPPNRVKERKGSRGKKRPTTYYAPLEACRKHFEKAARMEGYRWLEKEEKKKEDEAKF